MDVEPSRRDQVTELLTTTPPEGAASLDHLVPVIYEELRAMAHRQLRREYQTPSIQTTELVHELYLKLVDDARVTQRGRAYFYGTAARAMRQVLVDAARKRNSAKRGGGMSVVTLDDDAEQTTTYAGDLLDLDRALSELAKHSPRQANVVECRYFGGMGVEETATALDVSPRTVKSDWALAKAWLFDELRSG
jgi:RNA polymerase sigma factor (TIGR02999 family)